MEKKYKNNNIVIYKMKPFMPNKETKLLYKYLDKATYYFEFGSGGSTYQASLKDNIKEIWAVENDNNWLKKLKNKITSENVNYIFINMNLVKKFGGKPKNRKDIEKWYQYSRALKNLDDKSIIKQIDTVLIDGRFRVACALNCFGVINDDTVLLFDDFHNRKFYHKVLDYYTVIEETGRMVVLKRKKDIDPPSKKIIIKFENDYR